MTATTDERKPAEIYDEKFVPALFGQWGPVVAGEAGVSAGNSVLDVACGTGALTLAAMRKVGPTGEVVGLDANPEMLEVARRNSTEIAWREGLAEALPFRDDRFDAVVSQFGFMFFEDRPEALREMMRVLKPGGNLSVAVCGEVEASPGYCEFATLLDRLFGREIGDAFRAPFILGNPDLLRRIAAEAGITDAVVREHGGAVRFSSVGEMISTERACVWTLGGVLDDTQFELLLRESEATLKPFVTAGGAIEFDMPVLILTARKANHPDD